MILAASSTGIPGGCVWLRTAIVRNLFVHCGRDVSFPGPLPRCYSSNESQSELEDVMEHLVLPRKGRPSAVDRERQSAPEFVE